MMGAAPVWFLISSAFLQAASNPWTRIVTWSLKIWMSGFPGPGTDGPLVR